MENCLSTLSIIDLLCSLYIFHLGKLPFKMVFNSSENPTFSEGVGVWASGDIKSIFRLPSSLYIIFSFNTFRIVVSSIDLQQREKRWDVCYCSSVFPILIIRLQNGQLKISKNSQVKIVKYFFWTKRSTEPWKWSLVQQKQILFPA